MGPRIVTPLTLVFLVLVLALGYFAFASYRKWHSTQARMASLEAEQATLKVKNASLAGAHEVLQNRRFQVCNRTSDEVVIPWFTAVYHAGNEMKVFDPLRCEGWQPQNIPTGGAPKLFNFSSAQEGCNWDGSVVFYAMRITRTNEEGLSQSFNITGPWQGFDRDCFTIQ